MGGGLALGNSFTMEPDDCVRVLAGMHLVIVHRCVAPDEAALDIYGAKVGVTTSLGTDSGHVLFGVD